jgi:hypothetical protein
LEGSNRIGFAGVGWALLSRSRLAGLKASLTPTVWEAFQRGDLDAEQVRVIDRVARRATEPQTLVSIDEKVIDTAQTKSPKQLTVWLLRLIVRLEPWPSRSGIAGRWLTVASQWCKASTASAMSPVRFQLRTMPLSTACLPLPHAAWAPPIRGPNSKSSARRDVRIEPRSILPTAPSRQNVRMACRASGP